MFFDKKLVLLEKMIVVCGFDAVRGPAPGRLPFALCKGRGPIRLYHPGNS